VTRISGVDRTMVLKGYFDESGSTSGNVYVLAGFFSTTEDWTLFSAEWEEICGQEPRTPDFKMRKAIRLKEYGWNEEQRDARIKELVDLIRKRARYRIDAVTARPNYDRIVRGNIPSELDNPYFILFLNIVIAMSEYMATLDIQGTVELVFDKQEDFVEEQCVRWYDWIKKNAASEISARLGGTPEFRHDKDVLPLKAADLYAWQVRRHLSEEQPQSGGVNDTLDSLLNMYGVNCNVRPEDLASLVYSINHGLDLKAHAGLYYPPGTDLQKRRRAKAGQWRV
jgi:Protein of unknown function (DUF3800)